MEKADPGAQALAADLRLRLTAAEKHLGVPSGTIQSMVADPDYVLIIKAVAIIEPVINDLIAAKFSEPNGGLGGRSQKEALRPAADFLADRLNLNGRAGKVSLARKMGLLTRDEPLWPRTSDAWPR